MKIYREIVTSLIALTMVGCAQIAVVSEKHPGALPLGSDRTRVAAQSIERGLAEENKEPIAALGEYVAAVRQSLGELKRNPRNAEAMRSYNFAIARIFGVIRDAKLDPWTHPLQVGAKGEFTLTWKGDPRPEWNLALYELIPADELTIKGTYVEKRVTKDGIGATPGREANPKRRTSCQIVHCTRHLLQHNRNCTVRRFALCYFPSRSVGRRFGPDRRSQLSAGGRFYLVICIASGSGKATEARARSSSPARKICQYFSARADGAVRP
jgi:hypothetical protein